jgi:hypothetical protein
MSDTPALQPPDQDAASRTPAAAPAITAASARNRRSLIRIPWGRLLERKRQPAPSASGIEKLIAVHPATSRELNAVVDHEQAALVSVVTQFEILSHLRGTRERPYCDYGPPSSPASARPVPAWQADRRSVGWGGIRGHVASSRYPRCRVCPQRRLEGRESPSRRRITPAMAAGVTDHIWDVADIVSVIEAAEPAPAKRGPYKKTSDVTAN